MIVERRDILFDYETAWEILRENAAAISNFPHNPDYFKLGGIYRLGALKNNRQLSQRILDFSIEDKKIVGSDNDVALVFIGKDLKEIASIVPDQKIIDILCEGCIKRNIKLPRSAQKIILMESFLVGLRLVFDNKPISGLTLEDDENLTSGLSLE